MAWSCEQIEASLSDYVDRLLDPAQRSEFEAHVHACARCAALATTVAGWVDRMHHFEALEVPPRLVYTILDRTLGPRTQEKGWRAWLNWLRPVWQPRFAYGAVTVLVTSIVIFEALGLNWRKPTVADLNPANIYRAANREAHLIYARGSKFIADLRVVYEIQSRLRPEAEAQPVPQQQPAPSQPPGQSNSPQQKSPRELNRAKDRNPNLWALACTLGAFARSTR